MGDLYRAVDKFGKTLDFMLLMRRNKTAATKSFARALEVNGLPRKIVIDKSGANTAGITAINRMLKRSGCPIPIGMVRIKFLNIEPGVPLVRTNRRGSSKTTGPSRSGSGRCWASSPSSQPRRHSKASRWPT